MASDATMSNQHINFLSQLLLSPDHSQYFPAAELQDCLNLAHKNHVVVRWLQVLPQTPAGQDPKIMNWARTALAEEQARIAHALSFLDAICTEFYSQGCDITVIKSLDHWPDLGSDLDLYSNAQPKDVIRIMKERFNAEVAERSWGDRLAGKWNFNVPGLPESVEDTRWPSGPDRRARWVGRRDSAACSPGATSAIYISRGLSGRSPDDLHIAAHVPSFLFSALRYRGHGTIA